ncbi:aromatic amino acid aminotransferase, partial [Klebsiella pneumoniae]|nr:aromatic amino acid aminotransferase [Klebsiella pneumoniae]
RLVLEDGGLTADWLAEVAEMRARLLEVRAALAAHGTVGGIDLAPLGRQNGLFSMLPLAPERIVAMREQHAIYMAGSGR